MSNKLNVNWWEAYAKCPLCNGKIDSVHNKIIWPARADSAFDLRNEAPRFEANTGPLCPHCRCELDITVNTE